jgi:hypothetical protein
MQACHICNQADFKQTGKDFLGEKPSIYPLFNRANKRFTQIFEMNRSSLFTQFQFYDESWRASARQRFELSLHLFRILSID